MEKTGFAGAAELFVDSEENEHYVALTGTRIAYGKLVNSLKNPFKLILLYGRPGTGKSYLLQRFYNEYAEQRPMFLFKTPTFKDLAALKKVFRAVTGKPSGPNESMNTLLERFHKEVEEDVYIMLDEAQMYTEEELEWIRVLANDRVFKFIFAVHKVDREDVLAKEHFKTRTFENIELKPLEKGEMGLYLERKLVSGGKGELLPYFGKRNFGRIFKYTGGNLRETNRLLQRLFTLLAYLEAERPLKLGRSLPNKYVEMAAIDLGMLDA